MPGLALPATPCRRRSQPGDRWRQWQDSTVSQRLLSARDRQYGYTVVWIPPPLREAFLDVAQAFRLYDALIHKPQRVLSADQLAELAGLGSRHPDPPCGIAGAR